MSAHGSSALVTGFPQSVHKNKKPLSFNCRRKRKRQEYPFPELIFHVITISYLPYPDCFFFRARRKQFDNLWISLLRMIPGCRRYVKRRRVEPVDNLLNQQDDLLFTALHDLLPG